jgi:oligopeptidase A
MSFAKHHQTGEQLPEPLYRALMAARNFRAASGLLRQVNLATKDLVLYSQYAPGKGESIYDIEKKVGVKFTGVKFGRAAFSSSSSSATHT